MTWSEFELQAARLRRNEVQLLRTALAANAPSSGLGNLVATFAKELHGRPREFAQVVESVAYIGARTYLPEQANIWAGARPMPRERDIVLMLIMWAVDALDRPDGTPERQLPEQSIRAQAVDLAENPRGEIYLFDLAMAVAFTADRARLDAELRERDAFARERLGDRISLWTTGQ